MFLAVTPEKTIPEIADSFNPALNNSLSLLCAFINYSLWKEVPNRINLFLVMTENLFQRIGVRSRYLNLQTV